MDTMVMGNQNNDEGLHAHPWSDCLIKSGHDHHDMYMLLWTMSGSYKNAIFLPSNSYDQKWHF